MILCRACNTEKLPEEFAQNKSRKSGLNWQCKDCQKKYFSEYYKANKDKHFGAVKKVKRKIIERKRELVFAFLMQHPCIDCGEPDPIVLEFDHINDKDYAISQMIHNGLSIKKLLKEIEKCVIRCANCHRLKTAKDFNYWTYRQLNELIEKRDVEVMKLLTKISPEHKELTRRNRRRLYQKSYVCINCNAACSIGAKQCSECNKKSKPTKIQWPGISELVKMVLETSFSETGKSLGVSDNAVRKHLKKFGIDPKSL